MTAKLDAKLHEIFIPYSKFFNVQKSENECGVPLKIDEVYKQILKKEFLAMK